MEESSAFNALNHLLDDLLSSFYTPKYLNDIGLILDVVVFEWLLAEQLPELCRHFRNIQLSLHDLIAPWFYSLFITHMPAETAFWLWDNVLLDGIVVVHEVGLAILRALNSDLLQLDNTTSIIERARRFTTTLRNPERLREHWQKLNKKHTMQARDRIAAKLEEEKKNGALKKCNELEMVTNFKGNQVRDLWVQYILVDPFLHYGTTGFDFEQFSQLIGGTFNGWSPCSDIVERLFTLADTKKDGIVCFQELFILFSVMCRGSFVELVQFNFKLFDVAAKGWLDKFDLYRMLQSIYSIFEKDSEYRNMLRFFVESIYKNCVKTLPGVIYVDSFEYVVAVQPQIMERFLTRNPKLKGSLKSTFYYWGLDCGRPNKNCEMISLELDRKAPIKQGQVTVPFVDE